MRPSPENNQNRSNHWRDKFSVWYQHREHKFSCLIYTGWSCSFFDFCCDNGCPDGRDVQAGLTDQMVCQRCGWILCISCLWFLVQSARPLHSNIFCGPLCMHVGLILIFTKTLCQIMFMLLNVYF
jgi:hypothetical protein